MGIETIDPSEVHLFHLMASEDADCRSNQRCNVNDSYLEFLLDMHSLGMGAWEILLTSREDSWQIP